MAQRLPVGTTGTRGQPVKATVPFQLRVAHSNNTSREPSSSSSSSSCLLLLTGTAGETACTVTPQRETSPAPSHKLTSRHHSNESTSLPASPFSIPSSISPAHPTLLLSSSPQTSSWSSSAGAPPGPSQLEPTRSITTTPAYKEIPSQPTAVPSCSSPSRTSVPRTFSLDTLAGPYLLGHWPRDGNHAHCAPCMRDKATQTPKAWADECSEKRRSSHKRSASWGSTDQLKEIAKLRQQLQRSKHSSRRHRDKERKSPFNGNHVVIGQSQTPVTKTYLIPVPKSTGSRFRNSVEGLNQEIERIIIRDPGERDEQLVPQDVPDGHRAPPPLTQRSSSTRSIDTQTPSSGGGGGGNHSNNSSRPDSISPSFLTVANSFGGHSPFNGEDLLSDGRTSTHKDLDHNSPIPKYAFSPKPNNSYTFKREPPEGCEKVKACEDLLPRPTRDVPQFLCPDRNKVNFIPKSGSAFCLVSILKPLLPTQELSFRGSLSPTLEQEQEQWVSRGTCTSTPQPCLPLHLEEPEG